jgi:hypothetical protein
VVMLIAPFVFDFPGVVGFLVVFGALVTFFELSLTCFFGDGTGT